MIIKNIIKILPIKLFSNLITCNINSIVRSIRNFKFKFNSTNINFIFGTEESFPIDIKIVKDFF